MTELLPVPAPRRDLGQVNPRSGPLAASRGAGWHTMRPQLQRVNCLDYASGLLAVGGGPVCCVWDTSTHALHCRIATP